MGAVEGLLEGAQLGIVEGALLGLCEGAIEGPLEGPMLGRLEGAPLGVLDGKREGETEGCSCLKDVGERHNEQRRMIDGMICSLEIFLYSNLEYFLWLLRLSK